MVIVLDDADPSETPERPVGVRIDETVETVWFGDVDTADLFMLSMLG